MKTIMCWFLIFMFFLSLHARNKNHNEKIKNNNKTLIYDEKYITSGNLGTIITNRGVIGDANRTDNFDWPLGANNGHLYHGSLWFGAYVNGVLIELAGEHPYSGPPHWGTGASSDTIIVTRNALAISDLDTYCWYTNEIHSINAYVYQRTYSYNNLLYGNFIIFDYTIENQSADTYQNCYIGFHMDCDISVLGGGNGITWFNIDDFVGYDSEYKISYIWDGDNPNIPGDDTGGLNGEEIGFMGQMVLHSDININGIEDMPSSHGWWDWNNDPNPNHPGEIYSWVSRTNFMPVPTTPHDYRYLQNYGPHNIAPNTSVNIVVAVGVGEGLDGLHHAMLRAKEVYENNYFEPTNPLPFPPPELTVRNFYPTPYIKWPPSFDPGVNHYNVYANDNLIGSVADSVTVFDIPSSLSVGTGYNFNVTTVWDDNSESSFSDTANLLYGSPTRVTGITGLPQNGSAVLSWNVNPENNIAYYKIYQDEQFITNEPGLSFTGVNLTNGVQYKYEITAFNDQGLESEKSYPVFVIPDTSTATGILLVDNFGPLNMGVKNFLESFTIYGYNYTYWNLVEDSQPTLADLSNYTSVLWFTGQYLGAPNSLWFLTNGGSNELQAYLDNGGNLWLSGNTVIDYISNNNPPITGDFEYDYLKIIDWDYAGYTDVNGVNSNFPYMRIDVAKDPNTYLNANILNSDLLTSYDTQTMYVFGPDCDPQYQDKPIAVLYPGSTFKTAITTFPLYYMPGTGVLEMSRFILTDIFGESYNSNPAPVRSVGLKIYNWSETVFEVEWNHNNEPDIDGYNLYLATSSTGPYSLVNSSLIQQTTYTLYNRTPGTEYFIKVSALDEIQQESILSEYVSEIAGRPHRVQNLEWTDLSNQGIATIQWDASNEIDITGYRVYVDSINYFTTVNTNYQINASNGNYYVFITAVDNMNLESYPSDTIFVTSPGSPILLVNGIHYPTYSTYMTDFYLSGACFGNHQVDIWDLFGNQGIDYIQLNSNFEKQFLGGGEIPDALLNKYQKVIWIGNSYLGDFEFFNPYQVLNYVQQGGNFLLATRYGANFFNYSLENYCGITEFSGNQTITPTEPLVALDTNLVDMGSGNGFSSATSAQFVHLDGNPEVTAIFKWGPSSNEWLAGFRVKKTGNGEFIFIGGRPYRMDLTTQFSNYDFMIQNWLGGAPNSVEEKEQNLIPDQFVLFQNYPNPFNPVTTFKFGLPKNSEISLTIYNILGQQIKKNENKYKAGYHEIQWNGLNQYNKQVASGVYIYKFEADKFTKTKKCIFMK